MDEQWLREWAAAEAEYPPKTLRADVGELLAENAKLRTQRQHLSDWSGVDISEIDRMYAEGELG